MKKFGAVAPVPVPSFLGEDAKKKIKTNFRLKAKVPLPSGEDFVY